MNKCTTINFTCHEDKIAPFSFLVQLLRTIFWSNFLICQFRLRGRKDDIEPISPLFHTYGSGKLEQMWQIEKLMSNRTYWYPCLTKFQKFITMLQFFANCTGTINQKLQWCLSCIYFVSVTLEMHWYTTPNGKTIKHYLASLSCNYTKFEMAWNWVLYITTIWYRTLKNQLFTSLKEQKV